MGLGAWSMGSFEFGSGNQPSLKLRLTSAECGIKKITVLLRYALCAMPYAIENPASTDWEAGFLVLLITVDYWPKICLGRVVSPVALGKSSAL